MDISPVREFSFTILFQLNYRELNEEDIEFLIEENSKDAKLDQKSINQSKKYIQDLLSKREEIDNNIKKQLKNWKFERLGFVEKTSLRMGFYELEFKKNVPFKVAIDESIKLTKKYGEEKSIKFVNGLLDRFAKGIYSSNEG
ncbi:transcription antitermination factor NusB [Geotoga petraea]|jgi:N utilization substance protein B|uniref:Transcription antitermination protein NusB n=1 Tax=Geotoga petraea TaxID=28234 RepID=A0A4Z0VX96_9BACT|nr:transcription antitermination factor NusB [Geotoga petraea]MDK2945545.1 transcription antitermination protein NusB [Geotoga sp.]TGG87250.1 transcription antitermination factor NusB [Geotoga petraea]